MTLRDQQAEATRQAIVDAFLELAHAENAIGISIPAVAARSGVSVLTIYRYFPSKDSLQSAAALRFDERARAVFGYVMLDESTFPDYLLQLWTQFATEIPAVLAEHSSPIGRQLRATRLPGARQAVRRAIPGLAANNEAVDSLVAITSSSMFIELVVRMGHSTEDAVNIVTDLVRLVIANATTDAPKKEGAL